MRKPIALILQQETSTPGRVGAHLRDQGHDLVDVRPLSGDALPDPRGLSGVVVFGGPMGANDDHLDGIRAELAWIPRVLAADVPYLGICLGGQLLARALGAAVERHPAALHEIGYTTITPAAQANGFLDRPHRFYQWHKDGFDLPRGATLLASGATFPNQAFSVGARTIGVQFHPEVTVDMMNFWMEDSDGWEQRPGAQAPDIQRTYAEEWNPKIDTWTGAFLKRLFG